MIRRAIADSEFLTSGTVHAPPGGDPADDILRSDDAADDIFGDLHRGGRGPDPLPGEEDEEDLDGREGDDKLVGGGGRDRLDGHSGADPLRDGG